MKALVYTGKQQLDYRDEPEPVAANGESIVQISAVGICGSDMHAYLGHDERRVPPLILGHEAVGTVVTGRFSGRRVALNPLATCGECSHCLGGRSNICSQRDIIGMYRPGAFATHVAVNDRNLIGIPDTMSAAHAALTEPCGTALHAVMLASRVVHRPINEMRTLVIGSGAVGLFAALVLRDYGADEVHIAETNVLRRDTAEKAGITHIFDPTAAPLQTPQYNVVIDAVGSRHSRALSCKVINPGGVIVHVGLQDNEGGLDTRYITLQEITVIGSYTYTMQDLKIAASKLHAGAYGSLDWPQERPLSEGGQAFADLRAGRCASPKIILRP